MRADQSDRGAEVLELLHSALGEGPGERLTGLLRSLEPATIADVLESLPRDQRPGVWRAIEPRRKGEVLLEVHREVREQLVGATGRDELLVALAALDMDELADLDADLPLSVVDAMVEAMDAQRRCRYEAVRSYPDDSAGGLMNVDATAVRADVTLKAVLRYLRLLRGRQRALPEHLDSLVVVDRNNRYVGMLRLSDLVSLGSDNTVGQVMTAGVPAIPVLTPADKVARLFEDHDLLSAPVIGEGGQLLGRITIDDVVDVIRDQADHQVMSRAGLAEGVDMFAPIGVSARRRAVWLGVNLINAFVAAWVIGLFEESIEQVVALAVLMPVVAGMGGVAGNQTLTVVTRGLALEQIGRSNAWRLLLRETALGLLNGTVWAVVVALVGGLWFGSAWLGIVFGVALILNLVTGALAGTLLPLLLQRAGIDPALAGGVLLTAATDVVGFFAFLGLATLVLL